MKTILLDVDGTLVDSMGVDAELFFSSIEQVLGPVSLRDLSHYDHVTDSGIVRQVIDDNGLSGASELAASVKARFIKELNRHIQDYGSFPVIDGALQFVDRIRRAADTRVAIATGCWRDSALLKLQTSGFKLEDIPVAACDDSPSRIDIMRSALRMTGDAPGTVTYFGDAEWDQRACDALGWKFIAVGPRLDGIESFSGVQI